MPPLILTGDTISVRLESRHLEVIRWLEKGTKVEARIRVPLVDIDRVVIVGRPNVSIAVLQRLMASLPTLLVTEAAGLVRLRPITTRMLCGASASTRWPATERLRCALRAESFTPRFGTAAVFFRGCPRTVKSLPSRISSKQIQN